MRKLIVGGLVILLAGVIARPCAAQKAEEAAQSSAREWLGLVDSGKYAESWKEAAPYFKANVSEEQWEKTMRGMRAPLGAVANRKLVSATYATSVPGAPDGQYVIIRYESSFEHKKSAVETITPMLDKDGRWRVSGYFIK
jgi:hypothetical protein